VPDRNCGRLILKVSTRCVVDVVRISLLQGNDSNLNGQGRVCVCSKFKVVSISQLTPGEAMSIIKKNSFNFIGVYRNSTLSDEEYAFLQEVFRSFGDLQFLLERMFFR